MMMTMMIQISITLMIMIMTVIFNKLIHAIHEFENFLVWLWKLRFGLLWLGFCKVLKLTQF